MNTNSLVKRLLAVSICGTLLTSTTSLRADAGLIVCAETSGVYSLYDAFTLFLSLDRYECTAEPVYSVEEANDLADAQAYTFLVAHGNDDNNPNVDGVWFGETVVDTSEISSNFQSKQYCFQGGGGSIEYGEMYDNIKRTLDLANIEF